jgi:ABC-type transporter Mla MlaB component
MMSTVSSDLTGNESDHTPARLSVTGESLAITGSVHFDNANAIYTQGISALNAISAPVVIVDLAQLSQSHTVLLAVIVQWIRNLKVGQRIHLENVPAKMQSIIQTSRLQEIL